MGADELRYRQSPNGIVRVKATDDGELEIPLTTFTAKIIGERVRDDGAERQTLLEIEAGLEGRIVRFTIGADEFQQMRWMIRELGARALVYPGQARQDHARAAIQMLSDPARRIVFAHSGWRGREDGKFMYLHGGGAIGAEGPIEGIEVDLPDALQPMRLPDPPLDKAELRLCVEDVLRLIDLGPDEVTIPMLLGVFRSGLGPSDFMIWLCGPSGVFKSELLALHQQFFGSGLDARHLPGNWSSTENALETLAFSAKDALLAVDDFAPAGTAADVQRLHQRAERLGRAQGNNAGRQRLRPDGTLRPVKPPRGLIVNTGEDVARGQSLRGRMLVLQLGPGQIHPKALSRCQAHAQGGRYALVMSAYLKWLAPRIAGLQAEMPGKVADLRTLFNGLIGQPVHARTPGIAADLMVGLYTFLKFAEEMGALTEVQAAAIRRRAQTALAKAASKQAHLQSDADPAAVFVELLVSCLTRGTVHVAGLDGRAPNLRPEAWGWRRRANGVQIEELVPMGERIGWIDGEDLYLDPRAAYAAAQRAGAGSEHPLSVTERTLWQRLGERGILQRQGKRDEWKSRIVLDGAQRKVLHLRAENVLPSGTTAIPAISAIDAADEPVDGGSGGSQMAGAA